MMRSLPPAGTLPLAILAVLLLAISGARAQQTDIRLSGDIPQPVLPADAQIQAADSIGDLTLVVWGSTVPQNGAPPRNVLLMQMVRGTVPLDTPRLFTSAEARPSGFVQVLNFSGHFMVLWNDTRSGSPQAYASHIGSDGTARWEELLDTDPIAPQGAAWGPSPAGSDLVWNSSNGTIRGRRTNGGIEFLERARTVETGSFARALSPAPLPATILLDQGSDGWLVLYGDRNTRSYTSFSPYHVADDGSIIAVMSGRLFRFKSVLDPQPQGSSAVPIPDSALAGSVLVGRDPAGRPLITYTVIEQRNIGTNFIFTSLQPYAIVETATGVFSAPEPAGGGAEVLFTTSCHTVSVTADSVHAERSCMNRYLVSFHLQISTTAPDGCSPPSGTWEETISLVFADSVLFSPSQRYPYSNYDPCARIPSVTVLRLASDSASMVAFARDSAAIRLSAPAAMQNSNLPDEDPALAQEGTTVLVGWRTTGSTPSATAGSWNPAGEGMKELGRLPLANISDRSIGRLGSALRLANIEDRSSLGGSGGGGAILAAKTRLRGEFPEYAAEWEDDSYYRLSRSGWQEVDMHGRHGSEVNSSMLSVKYNPDEKTTLLAIQRTNPGTGYSWTQLILWDSLGSELWRGDSVPWVEGLTPQYMPLRDSQSIVAYLGGMQYIDGTELGEQGTTAGLRQGGYAPFIKLYGEFLAQPYEIFPRGIILEIIGTDFTIPATSPPLRLLKTLPDPPFDMLALLQHPLDSGLIFLYGDSAGVHMDLFDRDLVPQRSGVTISSTTAFAGELSALMQGDSLFVIWSDTRNGPADIYGRALRLNGTSGVDAPAVAGARIGLRVAAAPNPAAGNVLFSWEATGSDQQASFLITDMRGSRVAEFTAPASAGEARWDCSILPPGVYHVTITAGNRRGICKLVRQ